MRASAPLPLLTAVLAAATLLSPASAQNLSDTQLDALKDNLWLAAQQTWELGTESQALLESDASPYAVFFNSSLPPPPGNQSLSDPYSYAALAPVLQIAYNAAASRSNSTGPQPVMYAQGGAAGDPASLGVAILLANWTGAPNPPLDVPLNATDPRGVNFGQGVTYARAAAEQLEYLLTVVPRTDDGAISHRIEQVQLWADFTYMVPPFLAYYAVMTSNQSLLQEAYTQIKLYRSYLLDNDEGLWRHILMGNTNVDTGFWSTGNAWAAAGMTRVLATIQRSPWASSMGSEMSDLTTWITDIHSGMYQYLDSDTALFHNYANETDSTNTGRSFLDASSTSLLASTVYRLALLQGIHTHVPDAEKSRKALSASASSNGVPSFSSWGTGDGVGPATSFTATHPSSVSASSLSSSTATSSYSLPTPSAAVGADLSHFSPQMWLTPVVDPYNWAAQGGSSPEGQAFVVEMYAAYRDWVEVGAPGINAAVRLGPGAPVWSVAVAGIMAVAMLVC
ncbi:Six-hairpin glycosidase-like protein [Rhodofomes roseus]|uniref:Six-hairpin glycosidase-like protein n=1 Tax=Rhodofomes roseus TaxID=34475 RepID=A0ABQ8JXK7_9APHY|nr:Six-hairpin glycosidase-like protein [Rhodofomes roseus]KAH9828825.1 Six-hairpin glycosidase-like protein [Rhodofomes roseus]